jgi:hypothetical protein
MKTLICIIIVLGLFEIVSNLYHLLKGNKESIGLSAKKQHQELDLNLGYQHFYVKAIIMLVFGFLFTLSGIVALSGLCTKFFLIVLALFALYGLLQAFYYKRPNKVWMSLVVYILPFIALLFLLNRGTTINDATSHHKIRKINTLFVFPFMLGFEPIKRLVVINLKKNDSEYEIIEPQYYNDQEFGTGLRILLYRTDKKVDVYYQPGVFFDKDAFAVGKGLGHALETEMKSSLFEFRENGLHIDIAFVDYKGREVKILIKEDTKIHNPFPFLAPVGNEVENPTKFFLVYMRDFDFVKEKGTLIDLKIGDKTLKIASFPIKRDGQKVLFARYATNLTIGEINRAKSAASVELTATHDNFKLSREQRVTNYWINCGPEIVELQFENGFPDLTTLPQNKQTTGSWDYLVSGTAITGGTYTLFRTNNMVKFGIQVTKKWKPGNLPLSFKVFTFIVKSFRTWPTSYQWNGSVNLEDNSIKGKWQRV